MRLPKSWKKVYILLLVSARQFYKNFRNEFKDVELELYDANKALQLWFHGLSILLVLLALVSLVGTIGFELESPYTYWNEILDICIITVFLLIYIGRLGSVTLVVAFAQRESPKK